MFRDPTSNNQCYPYLVYKWQLSNRHDIFIFMEVIWKGKQQQQQDRLYKIVKIKVWMTGRSYMIWHFNLPTSSTELRDVNKSNFKGRD